MPPRRRRPRRVHDPVDDDWECPYANCKMRCSTEWSHRRRYACMYYRSKARQDEAEEEEETAVQRFVGVYVNANGDLEPVSLQDALRAVAEGM